MRPLSAFEHFLERLFERPAARLFRAAVAPATLARRVERAIDEERRAGAAGTVAPTRFEVAVDARAAAELARLPDLERDLAAAALAHARRRGYLIPEPPSVKIVATAGLEPGVAVVRVAFAEGSTSFQELAPPIEPTRIHPSAAAAAPRARLRVVGPDGVERQLSVEGHPFAIGRGDDNDLVVLDPLVSRHHARLVPRNGRLVLTDLASRNGTRVNGRAVRDAVLGAGDRIEMGGTLVEVLPPEPSWTR